MSSPRSPRAQKSAKRTFQVAFYGATGAGKTTTLRALHDHLPDAGKSAFSEIPEPTAGSTTTTMFFDHQPPIDRGLKATLRMRGVAGADVSSQAFFSLLRCDALVFLFDAQRARSRDNTEAWRAATEHFTTYGISLDRLPIVIQLTKLDRPKPIGPVEARRQLKLPDATCVETNPAKGRGIDELARIVERQILDASMTAASRATRRPPRAANISSAPRRWPLQPTSQSRCAPTNGRMSPSSRWR